MAFDWKRWGRRLKQIRVKRGWSQRELAAKVGTSRNTINRWETGDRHPSMKMLERLARALKASIAVLLPIQGNRVAVTQPASTAPVTRLKFDVRLLFPRDEPFSTPLIRLMLATDDVRHLQKLLIVVRKSVGEGSKAEQAILNGELGHLFRLMCGHLYEAMRAFATLDQKSGGLLDAAAANDARAKHALERVRRACRTILSTRGKRSFIDVMRNFVGFHYNEQKLWKALDKHERAGHLECTLVLSPFSGLGRYKVTDHLIMFLIADEIGGDIGEFQQKFMHEIGEAIRLAGALGDVVDYFIAHLLEQHMDKIEQKDDMIRISPLLLRAKKQALRV